MCCWETLDPDIHLDATFTLSTHLYIVAEQATPPTPQQDDAPSTTAKTTVNGKRHKDPKEFTWLLKIPF